MTALLWVLLLALWTVVVVRLLGARATLSDRTFATYLVLGAFLGLSLMPFVQKLLDPYQDGGPLASWITALGRQAALLIPVAVALFPRRRSAAVSVADAFLLAFAMGFGYDLAGMLLTAANATTPLPGFSFIPPGQFDTPDFSVVGFGFWSALVAVTVVAMARFVRQRLLVLIVGAVVFVVVATEQATLFAPPAADSLLSYFAAATMHGKATAWVAILALVALSLLESKWISRAGASSAGEFQLLKDLQTLGGLLARLRFREFLNQSRLIGLRQQEQLVRAELAHSPGDPALTRILGRIEQTRRGAEASATPGTTTARVQVPLWRKPAVLIAAPWVALAILVYGLPQLPDAIGKFFWSPSSVLNFQFGALPTILNIALLMILVRRYIMSADRPDRPGEADDRVLFRGEGAILRSSLGAVLLVVLYGSIENLYSAMLSIAALFTRVGLPAYTHLQVTTVWLLFAVGATGFTCARTARWQSVPAPERRRAALHNAMMVAGGLFVGWVCIGIYGPIIALAHQEMGPVLWRTFAARGNYVAAELTGMVLAAFGAGVALLWSKWSQRAERFMMGR